MKKFGLAMVIALMSIGVLKAQSPIRWGVTAGMNISSEGSGDYKFTPGINIGGTVEYQFGKAGFLSSGLLLSQKGFANKSEYDFRIDFNNGTVIEESGKYNVKKKSYYLELPVFVGYKFHISEMVSLKLSAGPYVAVGLWGKVKDKNDSANDFSLYKDGYGEDFRRFDYGLGANLSVELAKHYQIGFGCDMGLRKTEKNGYMGSRNQNMTISFGYLF